jgi:hypothetical protein
MDAKLLLADDGRAIVLQWREGDVRLDARHTDFDRLGEGGKSRVTASSGKIQRVKISVLSI